MDAERLVFVTVGTESYRFDRLVGWVDDWLAEREGPPIRCVIQHGGATAPSRGEASAFLEYDHIEKLMREATAVVCHGGTGSVMLARSFGKRPIVVPREHGRGEHVDDHQVVFVRRMAARGDVVAAEGRDALTAALDGVFAGTLDVRIDPSSNGEVAVARFASIVDGLLAGKRRR